MRHFAILFVLLGCTTATAPKIEPELTVWFESVPLDNYSYSPDEWIAIEPVATATPAGDVHWCLYINDVEQTCEISDTGLRAGHRWYLERNGSWVLRMMASTNNLTEEKEWRWP